MAHRCHLPSPSLPRAPQCHRSPPPQVELPSQFRQVLPASPPPLLAFLPCLPRRGPLPPPRASRQTPQPLPLLSITERSYITPERGIEGCGGRSAARVDTRKHCTCTQCKILLSYTKRCSCTGETSGSTAAVLFLPTYSSALSFSHGLRRALAPRPSLRNFSANEDFTVCATGAGKTKSHGLLSIIFFIACNC